jgi:hypothetical protein
MVQNRFHTLFLLTFATLWPGCSVLVTGGAEGGRDSDGDGEVSDEDPASSDDSDDDPDDSGDSGDEGVAPGDDGSDDDAGQAPQPDAGTQSGDAGVPPEEPVDPTLETSALVPGSEFAAWAAETFDAIERDFRLPGSALYRENVGEAATALSLSAGVQLHALIAAGSVAQAEALADAMHDAYRCNAQNRAAYNATAHGCGARNYADNAWVAKGLVELYQVTGKGVYFDRAKEALAFSMSGENQPGTQPGGGIRLREGDADGQCLCATAPAMLANLLIYRWNPVPQYLDSGLRLYRWIKNNRFGYGPGYRGYENAVVLQGALLLWELTNDYAFIADAQHLAHAIESTYVDWQSHALREAGPWGGHDISAALVDLYEIDGDVSWLNLAAGYLKFLHDHGKDAEGRYPETWTEVGVPGKPGLLYQAAAARGFAELGNTPGGSPKAKDPVAVFQECNYGGVWRAGLLIGRYTRADLSFRGLTARDLSSLQVQPGYRAILYRDDNFQGESLVKTADDSCLEAAGWNDAVSSIVVERIRPTAVVYRDCNHTGAARHLVTGSYDAARLAALGISPKTISSLSVSNGFEVLLYAEDQPGGTPLVTGSSACLVEAGWNDLARSLVVRRKSP